MEHQLTFGSRVIDFTVQYQERKSLGIRVYPEGRVEVRSPRSAKHQDIMGKVRQKAPWIIKQIDYFNSYKPVTPARRFVNGETHLYLGRQYRLKIVPDAVNAVKAYRGQLWMHSQNPVCGRLKAQLNEWYKERAAVIFKEILEEVLPKFKRYRIGEPVLTIRTMVKRWGSCTSAGRIILNTELIKASRGCIEYVIVHELCHLIHHNHTRAFQSLLSKMMPDWRKIKERLEASLV